MSADVLRENGLTIAGVTPARLFDYELSIRPRVNLSERQGAITYGSIAAVTHADLSALYAGLKREFDLQYDPHPVSTVDHHGRISSALCFLCADMVDGAPEPQYLKDMAFCAKSVGAPQHYIDHISAEAD